MQATMIRRKIHLCLPHPPYRGVEYWYTMKLRHGGMVVSECGKFEYVEGTVSAFDFVDTRKWCFKYLEGLCAQIGYLGAKKFYAKDESGRLKPVVCEYDTWNLIIAAYKSREFMLYLDGLKTLIESTEGVVEGEVEYINEVEAQEQARGEDHVVPVVVYAGVPRGKHTETIVVEAGHAEGAGVEAGHAEGDRVASGATMEGGVKTGAAVEGRVAPGATEGVVVEAEAAMEGGVASRATEEVVVEVEAVEKVGVGVGATEEVVVEPDHVGVQEGGLVTDPEFEAMLDNVGVKEGGLVSDPEFEAMLDNVGVQEGGLVSDPEFEAMLDQVATEIDAIGEDLVVSDSGDEVIDDSEFHPIVSERASSSKKPSTLQGRQILVKRRCRVAKEKANENLNEGGKTAPYTISSSVIESQPQMMQAGALQPRQMGPNIRAPPIMNFNPQQFIGSPSIGADQPREVNSMRVFNSGGKKFTTLSSLREAARRR